MLLSGAGFLAIKVEQRQSDFFQSARNYLTSDTILVVTDYHQGRRAVLYNLEEKKGLSFTGEIAELFRTDIASLSLSHSNIHLHR